MLPSPVPGSLGSRANLLESLEIFQTQYINPKQRVIEKTFNWIRRINGIPDEILINRYSPQFSKVTTNMTDVLQILQSNITTEQKYYLLVQNDYDHKTAASLTGYVEGNDLKSQIPVAPQEPTQNITDNNA